MEVIKLGELGIFFIKSIVDSKLLRKVPKYILVFLSYFLSIMEPDTPLQSINNHSISSDGLALG